MVIPIKCLTLHQPWAWAITAGHKRIETRSWSTPYRGWLLIHAGKTLDADFVSQLAADGWGFPDPLERGAVVAVCRLIACEPAESVRDTITAGDAYFGGYDAGRYAWALGHIQALSEPVPCRGFQKLWNPPAEVFAAVAAQDRRLQRDPSEINYKDSE